MILTKIKKENLASTLVLQSSQPLLLIASIGHNHSSTLTHFFAPLKRFLQTEVQVAYP